MQATGWVWRVLGGGLTELGVAETLGPLSAAVVTYFVVPVMIFEKRGPRESMSSSTQLISKT